MCLDGSIPFHIDMAAAQSVSVIVWFIDMTRFAIQTSARRIGIQVRKMIKEGQCNNAAFRWHYWGFWVRRKEESPGRRVFFIKVGHICVVLPLMVWNYSSLLRGEESGLYPPRRLCMSCVNIEK
jgi:hypothetical protein